MTPFCDPKICIISLIGKSQLMPNQSKAWKLNSLLQKDVFNVTKKVYSINYFIACIIILDGYKQKKCD